MQLSYCVKYKKGDDSVNQDFIDMVSGCVAVLRFTKSFLKREGKGWGGGGGGVFWKRNKFFNFFSKVGLVGGATTNIWRPYLSPKFAIFPILFMTRPNT